MAGSIVDILGNWAGRQRWFAGKSSAPKLRIIGTLELGSSPTVRTVIYLAHDDAGSRRVLYQIPVTLRREALTTLHHAAIGTFTDEQGQFWNLYDGPHDPDFAEHLLELIDTSGDISGDNASAHGVSVSSIPNDIVRSRVLDGEQSNTSIIYTLRGEKSEEDGESPQLICKVFRALHHGENPDVVLQSELFAAGSSAVPATVGCVVGEWPDPAAPDGVATGHLAFAQEFLTGATDAWRLALSFAAEQSDFTDQARGIGATTADIHSTLASALPTVAASTQDIERAVAAWHERLEEALSEVPELAVHRESILALFARAQDGSWPQLQRVHGDLHLGQVLHLPDDSWAIIDFEGEPMRPLAERSHPDVPLRDVAGMLRSFSYVAGALPDTPGVFDWAEACRNAFLEGYNDRVGSNVQANLALLDAFELDKALYETVYEARNRPTWLSVPTAAVHRLAAKTHV